MNQNPHQTLHQQLGQLRDQAKAWADGHRVAEFEPLIGICCNWLRCGKWCALPRFKESK